MAKQKPMRPRPDFSHYVAHFTTGRRPFAETDAKDPTERDDRIPDAPLDRLISILTSGRIWATAMPWTGKPAVCFTECPWSSLLDHANRYSPYGIGFAKAHLFAAGGGPAIYIRRDHFERQQAYMQKVGAGKHGFDADLYALCTPFNPEYAPETFKAKFPQVCDYSYEREWRVLHDFKFSLNRIQFVVVASHCDVQVVRDALRGDIPPDKFLVMDMYRKIEELWPTHVMPNGSDA